MARPPHPAPITAPLPALGGRWGWKPRRKGQDGSWQRAGSPRPPTPSHRRGAGSGEAGPAAAAQRHAGRPVATAGVGGQRGGSALARGRGAHPSPVPEDELMEASWAQPCFPQALLPAPQLQPFRSSAAPINPLPAGAATPLPVPPRLPRSPACSPARVPGLSCPPPGDVARGRSPANNPGLGGPARALPRSRVPAGAGEVLSQGVPSLRRSQPPPTCKVLQGPSAC